MRRLVPLLVAAAALAGTGQALALPVAQPLRTWAPNGPVTAIAPGDGVAYIAGDFTRLAPPTGGFAVLRDGAAEPVARIDEAVRSVLPDGSGGWVLFGQSELGDRTLIHVLADGSVGLRVSLGRRIESWLPRPVVSRGRAILVRERSIFHYEAYAIDLATGAETGWVSPTYSGPFDLLANDEIVVMRTTDGRAETLVALDPITGAVAWSRPGHVPLGVALGGGRVYLSTWNANGVPAGPTIALDAATGADVPWSTDPACSGPIVASGGLVVVKPDYAFTPDPRVALIDPATGTCTRVGDRAERWSAIAIEGDTAYLASAQRVVAIGRAGAVREVGPPPNGSLVEAIAVAGGRVAIAGSFSGVGGAERAGLAAIDTATGQPTAWDPRPVGGTVASLARMGSTVFVGGSFTGIAGTTQARLAALDATTGEVLPWRPQLDGNVTQVVVDGVRVYVSGDFTHVGEAVRRHVAVFSHVTGQLLPFAPRIRFRRLGVDPLIGVDPSPRGPVIFGQFTRVNGQPRPGVALLDGAGRLRPWNPETQIRLPWVVAAAAGGRRIALAWNTYNGPSGSPLLNLGAFDYRGKRVADWAFDLGSPALLQTPGAVYLGGRALETRSGATWDAGLRGWSPQGYVAIAGGKAIAADRRFLYLGGSFSRAGGLPQANLAIFPALPGTRP